MPWSFPLSKMKCINVYATNTLSLCTELDAKKIAQSESEFLWPCHGRPWPLSRVDGVNVSKRRGFWSSSWKGRVLDMYTKKGWDSWCAQCELASRLSSSHASDAHPANKIHLGSIKKYSNQHLQSASKGVVKGNPWVSQWCYVQVGSLKIDEDFWEWLSESYEFAFQTAFYPLWTTKIIMQEYYQDLWFLIATCYMTSL